MIRVKRHCLWELGKAVANGAGRHVSCLFVQMACSYLVKCLINMITIVLSRLGPQFLIVTFSFDGETSFIKSDNLIFFLSDDNLLIIFFDFGQLIKVVGVAVLIR